MVPQVIPTFLLVLDKIMKTYVITICLSDIEKYYKKYLNNVRKDKMCVFFCQIRNIFLNRFGCVILKYSDF